MQITGPLNDGFMGVNLMLDKLECVLCVCVCVCVCVRVCVCLCVYSHPVTCGRHECSRKKVG